MEVERSRREAASHASSLRVSESQLVRYIAPPIDSPYPLEHAYALLGDIRGASVLDFGCGNGENTLLLARRGARVVGLDISDSLIGLARERLAVNGLPGAAEFVVGSAHDLPFATGSFDVVFGMAILHHLDLDLAAREVFRVLKDGGRAIFKEPVRDSRLIRAMRRAIPYRAPDVSPFERPLTVSELRRFASPFRTDSIRAFSLPFVNLAHALSHSPRYIDEIYRADRTVLQRFPRLARLAGIRVLAVSKSQPVAAGPSPGPATQAPPGGSRTGIDAQAGR